jgi:hypothetical protein
MGNEMLIKVDKSKKTLDILNKSWSGLIKNGLNFTRIHANPISRGPFIVKITKKGKNDLRTF